MTYSSSGVVHPNVTVKLTGNDNNAFFILGSVSKAMKRAGIDSEEIAAFLEEATSGDYNNLLATCLKWVNVE